MRILRAKDDQGHLHHPIWPWASAENAPIAACEPLVSGRQRLDPNSPKTSHWAHCCLLSQPSTFLRVRSLHPLDRAVASNDRPHDSTTQCKVYTERLDDMLSFAEAHPQLQSAQQHLECLLDVEDAALLN